MVLLLASLKVLGILKCRDALSLYLFTVVMEALSCLLKRVSEGGRFSLWVLQGKSIKRGAEHRVV